MTISSSLQSLPELVVRFGSCVDEKLRVSHGRSRHFAHTTVAHARTGWVAIGLSSGGGMRDADIYVGVVSDDGTIDVTDRYSNDYVTPTQDTLLGGNNNAIVVSGKETMKDTTITFRRALRTADVDGDDSLDHPIRDRIVEVIWAFGNDDLLLQHLGSNRGSCLVNLLRDAPKSRLDGKFDHTLRVSNHYFLRWSVEKFDYGKRDVAGSRKRTKRSVEGSDDDDESKWLVVEMSAKTDGWVGVGFDPEDTGMLNADIVVGSVSASNHVTVTDMYSTAYAAPGPDTSLSNVDSHDEGTNDVYFVEGERTNGWTTIVFWRLVESPDTFDNDIDLNGDSKVIWAFGANQLPHFLQHESTNHGVEYIDLNEGPGADSRQPEPEHSHRFNDDYKVSWSVIGKEIYFELKVETEGWVGFGLKPKDKGMDNADMMIGAVYGDNDNDVDVHDFYSHSYRMPNPDVALGGTEDIRDVTGEQKNGQTTLRFWRLLDTDDKYDASIKPGRTKVIWAYGDDDDLEQHDSSDRGFAYIHFDRGDGDDDDDSDTLKKVHGSLMAISWSLFIVVAVVVARFLKRFKWWFPVHIALAVVGLLGVVAGLVVIIIGVENDEGGSRHFNNVHSWFGLAVIVLSAIQPILGVVADRMYKPGRDKVPVFPDKVHWWLGRFLLVLAAATTLLGFDQLGVSTAWYIVIIAWWAFVLAVMFAWDVEVMTASSVKGLKRRAKERRMRIPSSSQEMSAVE
eukprot:TRINITY_DN3430_c0_g1_i3.p1 TRINITY_DN3430_c0_g1~~TRINITY_DN3430_c0_g1_i3.p1  ORF type:complete len:734 (-),score=183.04 TRINITY_DN3430_c0_g1_i3:6-2207(-)